MTVQISSEGNGSKKALVVLARPCIAPKRRAASGRFTGTSRTTGV
jgi:hypothetical protein